MSQATRIARQRRVPRGLNSTQQLQHDNEKVTIATGRTQVTIAAGRRRALLRQNFVNSTQQQQQQQQQKEKYVDKCTKEANETKTSNRKSSESDKNRANANNTKPSKEIVDKIRTSGLTFGGYN